MIWRRRLLLIAAVVISLSACDTQVAQEAEPQNVNPDDANLYPSSISHRVSVGGVTTLQWEPVPALGPRAILQRPDGKILASGKPGSPCSVWLYEPKGGLIWEKTIDDLIQCTRGFATDEGFIFFGTSQNNMPRIVLTDLEGDVVGSFAYSADGTLFFPQQVRGVPIRSAGIILHSGNEVTKLSSTAQIEWSYRLRSDQWLTDIVEKDSRGYLLVGKAAESRVALPSRSSAWVISLDLQGNLEWTKDYQLGSSLQSVHRLAGGDYLLTGLSLVQNTSAGWFTAVDSRGSTLWDSDSTWSERPPLMDEVIYVAGTAENLEVVVTINAYNNLPVVTYALEDNGAPIERYNWPFTVSYLDNTDRRCWLEQMVASTSGDLLALLFCTSKDWISNIKDEYRGSIWTEINFLE